MFEGWDEFYLLVGSAAAVLIGLIFVVISLMQDRSRSSVLSGARLYMGPIVLSVSFVLVVSALALTPGVGRNRIAGVFTVVALWGLYRGIVSCIGIWRVRSEVHWTDIWFYGVIPSLLYIALAGLAYAFWTDFGWATDGLAWIVTGLLLLAIRNEWDLITWIAPRSGDIPDFEKSQ
jgi:hypothetical protein